VRTLREWPFKTFKPFNRCAESVLSNVEGRLRGESSSGATQSKGIRSRKFTAENAKVAKKTSCHFDPFGEAQDKLREKSFSSS